MKGFQAQNIFFRKDCTYQRMLQRCKEVVYPVSKPDADYYIANANGIAVSGPEGFITLDRDGVGSEQKVPWTLEAYIRLSKLKYPSKAKFYCVEVQKGTCINCILLPSTRDIHISVLSTCSISW